MHMKKIFKCSRARTAKVMLMPLLSFLIIIAVFPGIYLMWISFTDLQINNKASGTFVGLSNYISIFSSDSIFLGALGKTLIFCAIALPIEFLLGYIIAKIFAAAQSLRGVGLLRTIYLFPLMITPLSVGLFWNYLLNPKVGAVNFLFFSLNLPAQEWLSKSAYAFPSIIGIYLWQWTPFVSMLVLAGLLAIPGELYESADVDGARWWHKVLGIDIPMIKNVLGIALILSIVQIIQTFELVLATTNGGPGTSSLVSGFAIYREAFKYFQNGKAGAESIIIMLLATFISQILARFILKGEEVPE